MRLYELLEGLDKNQQRVGQVGAEDKARTVSPVLGKKNKQHPYKGRLVGEQGVAEAFGPLPRDNQQIQLGRFTVRLERVGMNKNYIGFTWHDSRGQEHYEEVPVGDLGSYDDLKAKILDEIKYQERKLAGQGVAEGLDESFSPDELSTLNQYLDDEISWQELKRGYSDLVRKAIKHFDVVSMSGVPMEFQFYDRLVQARDEGDLGEQGVAEVSNDKIGGRYDPEEWDAMVRRVGQRAKQGPLKTVWDPVKRVYKNVPVKDDNKKDVDEAQLGTMRKYFAGDKNAHDELKITQMRQYFDELNKKEQEEKRKREELRKGTTAIGGRLKEVAPEGMEDWINDRKADFKKRYGDRWQEVLYATAWKRKKNH